MVWSGGEETNVMTRIHAIQINQDIQRIDGSHSDAERAIETATRSSANAAYLFGAVEEEGYERKKEELADPDVLIDRFSKHPFRKR
jgi:hypothetical protein